MQHCSRHCTDRLSRQDGLAPGEPERARTIMHRMHECTMHSSSGVPVATARRVRWDMGGCAWEGTRAMHADHEGRDQHDPARRVMRSRPCAPADGVRQGRWALSLAGAQPPSRAAIVGGRLACARSALRAQWTGRCVSVFARRDWRRRPGN
jgi:hypothetical protein